MTADTPERVGRFFADWARGRRQERVLKEIVDACDSAAGFTWTCDACGNEYPVPPNDRATTVCFCDEDTRLNFVRGEAE